MQPLAKRRGTCYNAAMQVTYPLEGAAGALRSVSEGVYYRIRWLEERIADYILHGDAFAFLSAGTPRDGLPAIVAVRCDDRAVASFERKMQRVMRLKYSKAARAMPVADFPVCIEIACGGAKTWLSYTFGDDVRLVELCKEAADFALYNFRHRYSRARPQE